MAMQVFQSLVQGKLFFFAPRLLRHHRCSSSSSSSSSSMLLLHAPPTSAYIHLPFCKRRCFYCDFPVLPVGQTHSQTHPLMESYVDYIIREISATLKHRHPPPLTTLFLGGGTPSLLPPPLIHKLILCLQSFCGFASDVEISIEMDPGTFDSSSLNEILGYGVNRISLGVQAFQDSLLRQCGRSHGLREVHEAISTISAVNHKNWSLDLISSLPFQTMELWKESLSNAVAAQPAHISVYDLQVEEGTKFWQWYKPGKSPLPTDDNAAQFYRFASGFLQQQGYEHYEISNYAKPGYQCLHNLVYWRNLPYYAFGLGSTSYIGGCRFSRPKKLKDYFKFVEELEMNSVDINAWHDNVEEKVHDTLMLSFRLARGVDVRDFRRKFGTRFTVPVIRALLPFVESGHAVAVNSDNEKLCSEALSRFCESELENVTWSKSNSEELSNGTEVAFIHLSDPEGFLYSNEIISSVFSCLPG